jgi:DNA polymerase III subunit delta'
MIDITQHPRLQPQLLGHQECLNSLWQQFQSQKLHPALLVTGPRGIGKATMAYNLARQIFGVDQGFHQRLIDNNSHPNLLTIELGLNEDGKPQKEITVHEVRKVIDFCRQSPALPGWRVIIIDAVDEMNRNGANALLKVLEEPPAQTQFILVCHAFGRLLPTIRSRCLKVTLKPLENMATDSPHALALALAQGSYGRYHALVQQNVDGIFDQTLGLIGQGLNNQISAIQATLKTFPKGDSRLDLIPELLVWFMRRLLLLHHGVAQDSLACDQKIRQMARGRDAHHWVKSHHACQKFVDMTQGTHLDPNHVLMSLLMILVKPTLVDEYIYDS